MPFRDLREYLEELEERGELVRVKESASPVLEIPEVLRRLMRGRGPAVLFENVEGHPGWRVVGNLFGTLRRIKLGLGVERLEEIGERFVSILTQAPPLDLVDKLRAAAKLLGVGRFAPRKARKGAFEEVVGRDSLVDIPAFKSWPGDAGRYITYGMVITRIGEVVNIGVYRIQILNEREALIHWQIHKRAREAALRAAESGSRKMPVAIVIGSDPGTMLSAIMPAPYPLDELLFTGIVRGEGLEVVEAPITGLPVPANAEVVIEGYVDLGETRDEGPFGDHYGVYDYGGPYPVFKLEQIARREDPIYYGTVVGYPDLEDGCMGYAVSRIFLPILRTLMPEVVDYYLPPHGLFQGVAIVSIRKRYPGHGKKVMLGLWGLGHMMALTKVIIVVDEDVNPRDLNQVIHAIATRVDPQRDVVVIPGAHVDQLDTGSPTPGYGSKLGIDATRKLPEEYGGKPWPREVEPDPDTVRLVDEKWGRYFPGGLSLSPSQGPGDPC